MASLKYDQSLLEENVKLKRKQAKMNDQMDVLITDIKNTMGEMSNALKELSSRSITDHTYGSECGMAIDSKPEAEHERTTRPFIPSVDVGDMKINVSQIKKKKMRTNLTDAADQLLKLKDQTKG